MLSAAPDAGGKPRGLPARLSPGKVRGMADPAVRPARSPDLDAVFLLGYDAWGDGQGVDAYLAECRSSPKYALGRWYVLEKDGRVLSALIAYRNAFRLPRGAWGLGSLCTLRAFRRLRLASRLAAEVLKREKGTAYLWADAAPELYRALGFVDLPHRAAGRPGSLLMARGPLPKRSPEPLYF